MEKQRQKLKLIAGSRYQFQLMYDHCLSGSTPFEKQYYLYAVQDIITKQEYIIFPELPAHNILKNFKKDDCFSIEKKPLEGSKGFEYEIHRLESPETVQKSSEPAEENLHLKSIMISCLKDAVDIRRQFTEAIDITSIAMALFSAKIKAKHNFLYS